MNRRAHVGALGIAAISAVVVLAGCGTTVPQTTSLNGASQSQLGTTDSGTSAAGATGDTTGTTGGTASNAGTVAAGVEGATAPVAGSTTTVVGPGGSKITTATTSNGAVVTTVTKNGQTTTTTKPAKAGSKTAGGASAKPSATKSAATTAAANYPGLTATTINVGMIYSPGNDAALKSVGANFDEGDELATYQAIIKEINAAGGIAGRQIVLNPYAYSSTDESSFASQEQAACDSLTEDTKNFVVVGASFDAILRACFQKAGTLTAGTESPSSEADFNADPITYDPDGYIPDGVMKNLVPALKKTDYFTSKWNTTSGAPGGVSPVKIGIVYPDNTEANDAVQNQLLPALAAAGYPVAKSDVITYEQPTSVAGDDAEVSAISSAVLQFRSDGVTNYLPYDAPSLAFFSNTANSQEYYPRYGITTLTEVTADYVAGLIPAKTLSGAIGLGFLPSLDLSDYSAYVNPGEARCRKALADGQVSDTPNSLAEAEAFGDCDSLYTLKAALEAVPKGTAITPTSVMSGLETLTSGFPFAGVPAGSFGAGKHYPIDSGYAMQWDTGCSCVKYTSAAFPLANA